MPGNSLLHKLDARAKFIALILLIVALFAVRSFVGQLIMAVLILILLKISQLPLPYFFRGLRPVLYILVFTAIVHVFMTKGGETLLQFGFISVDSYGVYLGTFMVLRIILLIASTSLLTLTTSPIALTDGLEFMMKPLRRIGVPSHEIAMMMTIALRFIPTLMEEAEKIMKAQMARGADFESGNIFRRAKNMVPILVPLFVSAFRRADDLAIAMEARCYRGGQGRTRLHEQVTAPRDYYAVIFSALFLSALILLKI